jgi:hypothetical protein
VPADDLAARIDELRRPLDAGELADLPPIDLGNEATLSHVERAVRRMLQEVEMFRALSPAERALPHFRARRVYLADNLRRLRERLGDAAAH